MRTYLDHSAVVRQSGDVTSYVNKQTTNPSFLIIWGQERQAMKAAVSLSLTIATMTAGAYGHGAMVVPAPRSVCSPTPFHDVSALSYEHTFVRTARYHPDNRGHRPTPP
jgi:hypothetical protein